jgi:hypothetical protein
MRKIRERPEQQMLSGLVAIPLIDQKSISNL